MKEKQMSLFNNQKAPKNVTKAPKSTHVHQTKKRHKRQASKASRAKKRPVVRHRRNHKSVHKNTRTKNSIKEHRTHRTKNVSSNTRKRQNKNLKETNKAHKTNKTALNKSTPNVQTIADKAYNQLAQANLISKCHIYKGGEPCQSIALSYIDSKQTRVPLGEDMNKVCKQSNLTKPYCYYRYLDGRFILINGWLMNQIYKYRDDIK